MQAQFQEMMRASMARGVADAQLRVWTPQGAQVLFVRQVAPTVEDLTDRRVEVNPLTGGYPTGAWADESRDYHVGVRVAGQGDRPGAARRARAARDRRQRRGPGPGEGDLVQRLRADRQDRPAGRALHRPDRARRDDPGGPGGQGRRRRRRPRRPSSAGPSSSPPRPATTRRRPSCARWSTSTTRRKAPSGSRPPWTRPTRWRSTPPRPRPPGSRSEHLPRRSRDDRDRLLRRLRHRHGCRAGRRRRPRTPAPDASGACPNCSATNPANALFCEACGYDFTTGTMPRPLDPAADRSRRRPRRTAHRRTRRRRSPSAWVAEVWIDPDWYADQESTDPLPSPGLPRGRTAQEHLDPDRPRLAQPQHHPGHRPVLRQRHQPAARPAHDRRQPLVGRGPRARRTAPTSAATSARCRPRRCRPARSRRSPQDDRIYVGAWTRIVVRRAADGE